MNLPDPDSGGFFGLLATAVITVGGAIMAFRRKASSDGTALVRDAAERDILGTLVKERDEWKTMWQVSTEMARKYEVANERLAAQVEHLTRENTQMALRISALDNNVRDLHRLVLSIAPDRAAELFEIKEPTA